MTQPSSTSSSCKFLKYNWPNILERLFLMPGPRHVLRVWFEAPGPLALGYLAPNSKLHSYWHSGCRPWFLSVYLSLCLANAPNFPRNMGVARCQLPNVETSFHPLVSAQPNKPTKLANSKQKRHNPCISQTQTQAQLHAICLLNFWYFPTNSESCQLGSANLGICLVDGRYIYESESVGQVLNEIAAWEY